MALWRLRVLTCRQDSPAWTRYLPSSKEILPGLKVKAGARWMGMQPFITEELPVIDRAPFRPNRFLKHIVTRHTFSCIDGHTRGTPARVVAGGDSWLEGPAKLGRHGHFLAEVEWIHTGQCSSREATT